jgi:hypothetical protein
MPGRPAARRRLLRSVSVLALVVALLGTAVAGWFARLVVDDQQHRLLTERTDEVALLMSSAISTIPAQLSAQGGILRATNGSRPAYERAATNDLGASTTQTFAWLRRSPDGGSYEVLAAAGPGLAEGDVVTDPATRQALDRAMTQQSMVATRVHGADRRLGFALGPPAAPAGTVVYRESALGPVRPPQAAGTAPFSELDVAIYATPTRRAGQVLVSTTDALPMDGDTRTRPLAAGASKWVLVVQARGPLVGRLADSAPTGILVVGLLGSLLIAAVIESTARRRDAALALYAGEHQLAETLQRSLLPQLPDLPGLDLAARYLASGSGQMVGGDWFDVFPVHGGRVGVAVGDVIGHDLAAASAMAQIRATLRAYAVDGDPPVTVVTRLDHLVDTFALTQLVTVMYGVLEPSAADGSRLFRWTNAGHLPPLLRHPSGRVEPLAGGDSVVIGAPIAAAHAQAERVVRPGSTLVLFTDGLVERPGGSLDDAMQRLADSVAQVDGDADALCEHLIDQVSVPQLRDDIALLAVRLTGPAQVPATQPVVPAVRPAVSDDLVEG